MITPQFCHVVLVTFLGFFGTVGLVAVLSPRLFSALATRSSRWINAQDYLDILDKRFDIDRYLLPHSRILGGLVIVTVILLIRVFLLP